MRRLLGHLPYCPLRPPIGLDLGNRSCWYRVLDEAGQIQREPDAHDRDSVAGRVRCHARIRLSLETGTHSPLEQPLAERHRHRVIVANSRKLRLAEIAME